MSGVFERALEQYRNKGFAMVPDVVDRATAERMRTALMKAISVQDETWGTHPNYIDAGMVHNPMIYDAIFLELFANEQLNRIVEQALDPHAILYAFTSSSMPPQGGNYSVRIHVDSPRVIENYPTNLGVVIALDDFTLDNGATHYLPGSFERREAPNEDEFFSNAERPLPKIGDAVFFNARTWHTGGRNTTSAYRHAITMNFCRAYMRQRFDYPRMLGTEMLDNLDERSLVRLGYRVRTPVNLEQYYVPTEKRLTFPGQG